MTGWWNEQCARRERDLVMALRAFEGMARTNSVAMNMPITRPKNFRLMLQRQRLRAGFF